MQTSLKLKSEELTESILSGIRKMYEGQTIEVDIAPVEYSDDTEYLSSTTNNRLHLERALQDQNGKIFTAAEFEEFAKARL